MRCSSVKKHLEEYLLNELEPDVEIKINEHLNQCKICRDVLDRQRDVHEVLKGVDPVYPSADLYSRLRRHIGNSEGARRFLRFIPRNFVYSLSAFVLGVVVMFFIENIMFKHKPMESVEIRYEPARQAVYADTVAFYSVPAEHLVRR